MGKFNSCMKLRIEDRHADELQRIIDRFRVAANGAIRSHAEKIRRLHMANDYQSAYNEIARGIDAYIREAGCPEGNWARHYACINPIKEHVKRMKDGVKKKNGRSVRLPRYRNDATYYCAGLIRLSRNDIGGLVLEVASERSDTFNKAPDVTTAMGGKLTNGRKTWASFDIVMSDRVEKYVQRYAGMDLGSAILYRAKNGGYYISITWTREIVPEMTTNMLGIDTGYNIPMVVTHMDANGSVVKQWEYMGEDFKSYGQEIAQYAIENSCAVSAENLKSLGRKSMLWGKFKPSQIVGAVERECDRNNVSFVRVKAKNTSKRCNSCGHIHTEREWKAARPQQDTFICQSCGHEDNADYNASINIGQRALKMWD